MPTSSPMKEHQALSKNNEKHSHSIKRIVCSSSLRMLFPGGSKDFLSGILSKVEGTDLLGVCAFIDRIHLLQYSTSIFRTENLVKKFSSDGISTIEAYEKLLEGTTLCLSSDPIALLSSIGNMLKEHFIQFSFPLIERSILVSTEKEMLEGICPKDNQVFSYSVILALNKFTSLFPGYIRECTVLCLKSLQKITASCQVIITNELQFLDRIEYLFHLTYLFHLGILFVVLVKQNEHSARRLSLAQFFLCSSKDFEMEEKTFTESFSDYSMAFNRASVEFSPYSVCEPRLFCELLLNFFHRCYKEQPGDEFGALHSKITKLSEHAEALLTDFKPAIGREDQVIRPLSRKLRAPSIQKFSARCLKSRSYCTDETDYQVTLSENSYRKKQKARNRKRGMSSQRHEKDAHVNLLDEDTRQRNASAQLAYKKVLNDLQEQEHAMKTVDHHKALAMQGKKKKR